MPKYRRVVAAIGEIIETGVWRPGDRLPTEDELTQITSFSLGTVQRALRELSDRGLVVRRQGLGSFVAEPLAELHSPWHCRFVGDDGVTVLPIYSQVIRRTDALGSGPWDAYLSHEGDELMQIDRVININGEFDVFSSFHASKALLRPLWTLPIQNLDGMNFKQLISQDCELTITNIVHHVQISEFSPDICQRLGVAAKTSGMVVSAVGKVDHDFCVYFQRLYVPPNSRRLVFIEARTTF